MNYSKIYWQDVINGIGLRTSLFVSGCTIHCKGCFNTSAWDFNAGEPFTKEIQDKIISNIFDNKINISGLSILGGEPFDNIEGLKPLLEKFKDRNSELDEPKNVWIWSGYTLEQIKNDLSKYVFLADYCNYAVLGPFIEEQKNLKLRFRGSDNQIIYRIDKMEDHPYDVKIEPLNI